MVSYSIAIKCNLKRMHCYSESAEAAPDELSIKEAFWLINDDRTTVLISERINLTGKEK